MNDIQRWLAVVRPRHNPAENALIANMRDDPNIPCLNSLAAMRHYARQRWPHDPAVQSQGWPRPCEQWRRVIPILPPMQQNTRAAFASAAGRVRLLAAPAPISFWRAAMRAGVREALVMANAAPRCGARSKRTGKPCRAAAMLNGRCKVHGGKSTGPRTPEGLERSRRANWKHSRLRAAMRALRDLCDSI
jgi:hypothetical protein